MNRPKGGLSLYNAACFRSRKGAGGRRMRPGGIRECRREDLSIRIKKIHSLVFTSKCMPRGSVCYIIAQSSLCRDWQRRGLGCIAAGHQSLWKSALEGLAPNPSLLSSILLPLSLSLYPVVLLSPSDTLPLRTRHAYPQHPFPLVYSKISPTTDGQVY